MTRTILSTIIFAALLLFSACQKEDFLIGTWKASKSELVPQGTISPDKQMILIMINTMVEKVMKDMTIEFHKDGDYLIQLYQVKGLGTYELRADNSVLSLKEDETFGKIYAEVKDQEKEKALVLEFSEELMADPAMQELMAELDVPLKFVITCTKAEKG